MQAILDNTGIGYSDKEMEELFKKYRGFAYKIAYLKTNTHENAEDVVQECFFRLFRFRGKIRKDSKFTNILARTLCNICTDRARSKQGKQVNSLDHMLAVLQQNAILEGYGYEIFSDDLTDKKPNPEESLIQKENIEEIYDALYEITDVFREALIVTKIGGLSYEEGATIVGCEQNTMRSRIHRGRRDLERILKCQQKKEKLLL